MASSGSKGSVTRLSNPSAGPFNLAPLITVRLSGDNYLYWRTQVTQVLRSHLLLGFVDGSFACPSEEIDNPKLADDAQAPRRLYNPEFSAWHQQDPAILSAIMSTSTESVQEMILFASTAAEAWASLAASFSSQSTARPPNPGGGSYSGGGQRSGDRGGGDYRGNRGDGNRGARPSGEGGGGRPICQICDKPGHKASSCFKRFKQDYLGVDNDGRYMERQVAATTTHGHGQTGAYNVDSGWYMDTGATDHLTNHLDKLTLKDSYTGTDQVTVWARGLSCLFQRLTKISQACTSIQRTSIMPRPPCPPMLGRVLLPARIRFILEIRLLRPDPLPRLRKPGVLHRVA
ncbi:hypothetical protein QYE76_008283 [Lolium multiflorum]|uniref:Retrotransposon Copia-like N-terminal domain-containing protein n=1 Tax=Lolium multiflorum TaxID=4521 RepID=A0AAD8VCC3_LOLMU|nr:hypothetical protein QYE76_008283 [Lolium multiflorum]